jgi:biopolymer transport protein ExbB
MSAPSLSAVRRETKTLNRVGAGASRGPGGTPGMRESLRFPISCDRIRQHALSFIRVMPVVGLACVWFCSASGAQDVRPAPSENARAPAVDTVGPNSGASRGTPVSVPSAGSPTVVPPRAEVPQTSVPTTHPETSSPASAQPALPEPDSGRAAATEGTAPTEQQGGSGFLPRGMTAVLPDELSPWGMFVNADVVVKAVILGLALASVVTWTVWLAKTLELRRAKRGARAALDRLLPARSLAQAADGATQPHHVVAQLIAAAQNEIRESPDLRSEGIKERLSWQLDRIELAAGRHVARGMSILATIGAVAPFVGLFGTVWGIMNGFVGISRAHTTNLAVVAPGIAEALLATAFGLAAAIPAVVIYNAFTRSIGGYRALLADASIAVLRLVSRDLDRQAVVVPKAESSAVRDAPALSISEAAE